MVELFIAIKLLQHLANLSIDRAINFKERLANLLEIYHSSKIITDWADKLMCLANKLKLKVVSLEEEVKPIMDTYQAVQDKICI